jgi:hypothetical protein
MVLTTVLVAVVILLLCDGGCYYVANCHYRDLRCCRHVMYLILVAKKKQIGSQIYQLIQYIYYTVVVFYYKPMLCSKFVYSTILCKYKQFFCISLNFKSGYFYSLMSRYRLSIPIYCLATTTIIIIKYNTGNKQ